MTEEPTTERPVVLIVDDDPSVLLLIDVLAERLGFRTKAASSGLQALELLREGVRPAVILLDLMMERIDGVTFLNHLHEMDEVRETPIVAMSTPAVLERHVPHIQVDGVLSKPITLQTLEACLSRFNH
jgi:CheY-like chemotaxis protein